MRAAGTAAAYLPERFARRGLARLLLYFRGAWSMGDADPRLVAVRASHLAAQPDADADVFVSRWLEHRVEGMATSLVVLCRRRHERSVVSITGEPLAPSSDNGALVAFPHTSIDPLPQLALIDHSPVPVQWVVFPIEERGDERVAWRAAGAIPEDVERALAPIDDPRWALRAVRQLRGGGIVTIALDSPFEGARRSSYRIPVGSAELALSASLETLLRSTSARLYFSDAQRQDDSTWRLRLVLCRDLDELVSLSAAWISDYPLDWAGWPFLSQRVSIFRARHHAAGLPSNRELFPPGGPRPGPGMPAESA